MQSIVNTDRACRNSYLVLCRVPAAGHGVGAAFYYADPDQNVIKLNINDYGNEWTAAEHIKSSPPKLAQVDPDKMVAVRKAGASSWEVQVSPHFSH